MHRFSIFMALSLLSSPLLADENSPQFRGVNSRGVIEGATTPPSDWSADKNLRWMRELPGEGWSAPIIWQGKAYLTTAVAQGTTAPSPDRGRGYNRAAPDVVYEYKLYSLDMKTGKTIWERTAHKGKPRGPKHRDNTYASETPVTDGKRLYAYFGMTAVVAYDLDGKLLWKKDLGVYPMQGGWGTSSAPVVHDGLLFLQIDNEKESFVVALDAATGEQRWKMPRDEKSNWGNPLIWKNDVRTELVLSGTTARSYDPKTGKLLWQLNMTGRGTSTPVGLPEMLYIGTEDRSSRNDGAGGLFAIKPGADGDITPKPGTSSNAFVAWYRPKVGPQMASPLVYQGYVYTLSRNGGLVNCYDATTGKPQYERERLSGVRSFWSSPWAYDGKIFCPADDGTTYVLEAGPEFELLNRNPLPGRTWATPALTDNALLIRSEGKLYCIAR